MVNSGRFTRRAIGGALSAALLALVAAAPVSADTINIVGGNGGTATVACEFNAQTNTLTFTVTNTSTDGSVITAIGFDLPPAGNPSQSGLNGFTGNLAFQPAGTDFTFSDAALGGVPRLKAARLDFGFITGKNFKAGQRAEGLQPGTDPGDEATFTVSGAAFAGLTETQICNSIIARFK
jgi:hypothetical protein